MDKLSLKEVHYKDSVIALRGDISTWTKALKNLQHSFMNNYELYLYVIMLNNDHDYDITTWDDKLNNAKSQFHLLFEEYINSIVEEDVINSKYEKFLLVKMAEMELKRLTSDNYEHWLDEETKSLKGLRVKKDEFDLLIVNAFNIQYQYSIFRYGMRLKNTIRKGGGDS